MKRTLIITYDLHKPGQNYEALIAKIKACGAWAFLTQSTYLVMTEKTPVEVRDNLKTVLDSNDSLFVGVAPPPSAWSGLEKEVSQWILDNQK